MAAMFLTFMGTYNAVVINSESSIASHDIKFVKRLDEVYGVVEPGRMVAASKEWRKLEPAVVKAKPVVQVVRKIEAAPAARQEATQAPELPVAAVQEELDLGLVEVVNPRKWKNGVPAGQFGGSLVTSNGTIESLDVFLPNGEGIAVSFSEMVGNVFEYDLNGDLYTGMMYQVDQKSYMVTLTNGPLEGTRLRFTSTAPEEPSAYAQEQIAESYNNEADNYAQAVEEQPQDDYIQAQETYDADALVQADRQLQMEGLEAQGYNLENQTM